MLIFEDYLLARLQHAQEWGVLLAVSLTPLSAACGQEPHAVKREGASNIPVQQAKEYVHYKHRLEAEIAALNPAQRVDEYAEEQAFHKYDLFDEQHALIRKYILRDGLKALSRMVAIIDEYDPARESGRSGHKGERFDAMWMLLSDLDSRVVRLRASTEGRQAMAALERAIARMRATGHGKKDQREWAEHGRVEMAKLELASAKGLNAADEAIKDTLWVKYRVMISDRRLFAFSEFLMARDPGYPSWSERDFMEDYSRMNRAGNPAQIYIFREHARFYEMYLQFKKQKA